MLRNLLAEGALQQAFIPVYSQAMSDSAERARQAAGAIFGALAAGLIVLSAAGILAMPLIAPLITGQDAAAAALTVALAQIMFPFIMTASLTAVLAGISNAHSRFSIPALSPVVLNLVFIAGFLWLRSLDIPAEEQAWRLAWITLGGGILQLTLQAGYVWRCGDFPDIRLVFADPALKRIFTLMAPAALGASLFQLNQLTDIAIASYLIPEDAGAIPALRFSQRLIQLPTGVIGVALSTAILPALSLALRENPQSRSAELEGAISFSLFLTAPAAILMYFQGEEIINLLFYGGEWNLESSAATWLALQFYVIGVPFFSVNKILTAAFYAHQDTRTPVYVLVATVSLNLALNLVLAPRLHQGGIAISSVVSSVSNTALLGLLLRRAHVHVSLRKLFAFLVRGGLACAALALSLYLAEAHLSGLADTAADRLSHWISAGADRPRYQGMAMFILCATLGGLVYIAVSAFLGLRELKVFTGFLRRK